MKQIWYCEGCRTEWATGLTAHALLFDAISAIGRDHAEISDACHAANGVKRVRIRAPQCSDKEWGAVTTKAANRLSRSA